MSVTTVITIEVPVGRDHDLVDQIAGEAMGLADAWGLIATVSSETTRTERP